MNKAAWMVGGLGLVMVSGGCQNVNRSLVFATGTTMGVEISAKSASDNPFTFVFGYKRAEVLLDPVMEDVDECGNKIESDCHNTWWGGTHAPGFKIKEQAHSTLAKFSGDVGAGRDTTTKIGSWFASGRAAETLAEHPQTAVALAGEASLADGASNKRNKSLVSAHMPTIKAVVDGYAGKGADEQEDVKESFRLFVDAMVRKDPALVARYDMVAEKPMGSYVAELTDFLVEEKAFEKKAKEIANELAKNKDKGLRDPGNANAAKEAFGKDYENSSLHVADALALRRHVLDVLGNSSLWRRIIKSVMGDAASSINQGGTK